MFYYWLCWNGGGYDAIAADIEWEQLSMLIREFKEQSDINYTLDDFLAYLNEKSVIAYQIVIEDIEI